MRWKSSALATIAAIGIVVGVGVSQPADGAGRVSTGAELQAALDSGARTIRLAPRAYIYLTSGLTHTLPNHVSIVGAHSTLDARRLAGDAFVVSGGGNVTIRDLTLRNGPARGLVMDVPPGATGTALVRLRNVLVRDFSGDGVHLDDTGGSAATARVDFNRVRMWNNGRLASVPAGVARYGLRVEETGPGGIVARFLRCEFLANKYDGIQIDESDDGDIVCQITRCQFVRNGIAGDGPDDGVDIDERGPGGVRVFLNHVEASGNAEQGIDIDEDDDGDLYVNMRRVKVNTSGDDGIAIEETGTGNLTVNSALVYSNQNRGDGLNVTEEDAGNFALGMNQGNFFKNRGNGVDFTQTGAGTGTAHLRRVQRKLNRAGNTETSGVTIK